jgi:hypothetical protein
VGADRGEPPSFAGVSYSAWVGGVCIAMLIGIIIGVAIRGARAAEMDPRACRLDVPCIEADDTVRVPLSVVETGNRAFAQVLRERDEARRELLRLREKLGCV